MAGIDNIMAAIPGGSTRRFYGTAHWDGARWWAKLGDGPNNLLDAWWQDPVQPLQGGKIAVDITKDEYGQAASFVIGGYTDQPRPSSGTVQEIIPAGVATQIVIMGEDAVAYTTDRFIGEYSPGDPVYLTWDAAKPTVIGKIGASAPPPTPDAPVLVPTNPPGSETLIATASDTYWAPGGWGSYSTSRNGGEDIYTGTWYGNTVTGAWFYGAQRPALQGKTISRIRFRLPARIRGAGNYNDIAIVHFYAHTSGARPGGDVARVTGPHDIPVPPGFAGGDVDLPLSFAPALVAGGGISIAGNPYTGFNSRLKDANSGRLIIDWSS
ncbi:hypothetical protein HWD94_03960 [Pseudarthrobacter equi]|uniref:hypothetical protein n=1 Tax=Pseudarthrobacter equi TaxID=728066 RepID=UPI0021BF5957|nr:hypothetical protein [Pseudarthrobacter equi]MCT9624278.1 hypothetical protein [Pseudarthrobacter equi]